MEVFQKLTNLFILDNLNVIINGLYKKKREFSLELILHLLYYKSKT